MTPDRAMELAEKILRTITECHGRSMGDKMVEIIAAILRPELEAKPPLLCVHKDGHTHEVIAEVCAELPQPVAADDESRCAVCAWPLEDPAMNGCHRGDCSMRPRPKTLYAPDRAKREHDALMAPAPPTPAPPEA